MSHPHFQLGEPPICESKDCGEAFAIFTMTWPGSAPLQVCLACGARAVEAAQTLGFTLSLAPIEGASIYGDQRVTPSLRQLLEVE